MAPYGAARLAERTPDEKSGRDASFQTRLALMEMSAGFDSFSSLRQKEEL